MRDTKEAEERASGNTMMSLKHLGGYINVNGSNKHDVQARVRAGSIGWCNLRKYWSAPGPRRSKGSTFLANVAGRVWSGLEAH
eukprot:1226298-Pyramimonas_sp.AAC.1